MRKIEQRNLFRIIKVKEKKVEAPQKIKEYKRVSRVNNQIPQVSIFALGILK